MLPTPSQIREKLLTQLDEKNEVDEPTVVELISTLENYPFTRPLLEETRIGKMANDLRKRVRNETLARKLKQIVRNWQNLTRVNGSPAQAMTRLSFIPQVSPSPRVAHPAQQKGIAHTPTQSDQLSASLALQNSRPPAAVGRNGMSPGTLVDHSVSLRIQGKAFPTLTSCRRPPSSAPLPTSVHVSSPQVSCQVPSPAVPHSIITKVSAQFSSTGSSRTASPALNQVKGQSISPVILSPVVSSVQRLHELEHDPFCKRDTARASSEIRRKRNCGDVSENSTLGGRVTPTSVHSENSHDRVFGETSNGRQDSDGESSCSSRLSFYAQQMSHSSDTVSLTKTNSSNLAGNQKDLSKANISSRKRVRLNSISPPEAHNIPIKDTSLLETAGRVVNGHRKHGGKSLGKSANPCGAPIVSPVVSKSVVSPAFISSSKDSHANPPQSDLSFQQESDSSFPAQTLSWVAREKPKGKVKTTEQLIQELQRRNSSSNVGNSIMTKLRTNQIEKERDISDSVLPASMKSRGRYGKRGKKNNSLSVPSSDRMISKDEIVEHYLKTSEPSTLVDDDGLDAVPSPVPPVSKLEIGSCSHSCSKDSFHVSFSTSRQDQSESAPKDENSMDAASPSPPVQLSSKNTLEEIYAQLPPINYNIDWNSMSSNTVSDIHPVTDECVSSLHNDCMPGINGRYDINGEWTTWQQTLTLPSYNGEPLHILPYVDIF